MYRQMSSIVPILTNALSLRFKYMRNPSFISPTYYDFVFLLAKCFLGFDSIVHASVWGFGWHIFVGIVCDFFTTGIVSSLLKRFSPVKRFLKIFLKQNETVNRLEFNWIQSQSLNHLFASGPYCMSESSGYIRTLLD